ncbi:hypothetical protein AArcMg_0956 [Natrarchaeobaculum sulfurireducens]|uniref:Uncharacterized protein n=1 Tax=Natrarchaeobaculum sulfurireducens TaxID=2044521 RepID=A0A346PN79_9EURY|nr:hypothetical protein AArcMg_0956 [Natrarchaeobaculum sulfurireducens]
MGGPSHDLGGGGRLELFPVEFEAAAVSLAKNVQLAVESEANYEFNIGIRSYLEQDVWSTTHRSDYYH